MNIKQHPQVTEVAGAGRKTEVGGAGGGRRESGEASGGEREKTERGIPEKDGRNAEKEG